MEESPEGQRASLTIKFIGKGDAPKTRRRGDHLQIVPPRQKLACFHCGYWLYPFPESNELTLSIRIYTAISKAFGADHRYCKPHPDGRSTYIILNREWDDFMERYPKEREEWEKDHETTWARRDWGVEYDEWMSLPYEKKGRRE